MDLLPLTVQAASPHKVSPITRSGCTACHPELAGSDSEEKNAPVANGDCAHIKSMFNSTKNIKRRVHTFLYWKRMLGLQFPVMDAMLRDCVWKNLQSCEYGIR